jgi:hypothetical protein
MICLFLFFPCFFFSLPLVLACACAQLQVTIFLLVMLQTERDGIPSFQVTSSRARFERELRVRDGLSLGGPPDSSFATSMRGTGENGRRSNISLTAPQGQISLRYFGSQNETSSVLQLRGEQPAGSAALTTRNISAVSAAGDATFWSADPTLIDIRAQRVIFNGTALRTASFSADRYVNSVFFPFLSGSLTICMHACTRGLDFPLLFSALI